MASKTFLRNAQAAPDRRCLHRSEDTFLFDAVLVSLFLFDVLVTFNNLTVMS